MKTRNKFALGVMATMGSMSAFAADQTAAVAAAQTEAVSNNTAAVAAVVALAFVSFGIGMLVKLISR